MGAYDNPQIIPPVNYLAGMQEFNRTFAVWYSLIDKRRQERKKLEEKGDAQYAKFSSDAYVDPIQGMITNTELSINDQIQAQYSRGDFNNMSFSEQSAMTNQVRDLKGDLTASAIPFTSGEFHDLNRATVSNEAYNLANEMHNAGDADSTFRILPGFVNAKGDGNEIRPGQFGVVYHYVDDNGKAHYYDVKNVAAMFKNYKSFDQNELDKEIKNKASEISTAGENHNKVGNALGSYSERSAYQYFDYENDEASGLSAVVNEMLNSKDSEILLKNVYANNIKGHEGYTYLPTATEINRNLKDNREYIESILGKNENFDDFLENSIIDENELAAYHTWQKEEMRKYLTNRIRPEIKIHAPRIGNDPDAEFNLKREQNRILTQDRLNMQTATDANELALAAEENAKLFRNGGEFLDIDENNVYQNIHKPLKMVLDLLNVVDTTAPLKKYVVDGELNENFKPSAPQQALLENFYNFEGGDTSLTGNKKRYFTGPYPLTEEKLIKIIETGQKIDAGTELEFENGKWDEQVWNKYKELYPPITSGGYIIRPNITGGTPIEQTDEEAATNQILGNYSKMDVRQILAGFENIIYNGKNIRSVKIGQEGNKKILYLRYHDGPLKYKNNDKLTYPKPINLDQYKIIIATEDKEGAWKRHDVNIQDFIKDIRKITNQKEEDNFPVAYNFVLDRLGLEYDIAGGLPTN